MNFASEFRRAAADMADAIDETMGELVILTPMTKRPNYSAEPDPTKPTFTVTMVFTHKSALAFTDARAKRTTNNAEISTVMGIQTRKPRFSVKACNLQFELRNGFRLTRCFDETEWEVTSTQPDGISRIEIDVTQIGRAPQLDLPAPRNYAGMPK